MSITTTMTVTPELAAYLNDEVDTFSPVELQDLEDVLEHSPPDIKKQLVPLMREVRSRRPSFVMIVADFDESDFDEDVDLIDTHSN